MRERSTVFGEVADVYDDVRPGYPDELVAAVLSYAGLSTAGPSEGPSAGPVVEVGAGTGKATASFVRAGVPVRCVEADGRMAAVLRARLAADPAGGPHPAGGYGAAVEVGTFEDWTPPAGGVRLLYCAQAWHWMDPARRCGLAHDALAPGGAVALFAHTYAWAEPAMEAAVAGACRAQAPELVADPPWTGPPERHWLTRDLADSGLFTDVRARRFDSRVDFPTERYLRLVRTFSPVRRLPAATRAALLPAIRAAVDGAGGVVGVRLITVLALGRRPVSTP